tara:strand:+ start:52 stop:777 length:726 start_codon:yes stop_codon:yes gene_type:complete
MIKTKFGSIISHKFNNQYICYDSSIQTILKDRILASLDSDEFRLSNTSNFLDLNNGLIKKHFCRKGAMHLLNDNYFFYGLKNTRPLKEQKNYMDFMSIVKKSKNEWIKNKLELCMPIFSYVKRGNLFYKGDIILSKISGETLDKTLMKRLKFNIEEEIGLCFRFLFNNGIYNFDMNLTNIIYNRETDKFSFIDFDKVIITSRKTNSQSFSSRVIDKFRDSLKKYELFVEFDWNKFVRTVYG